MPERNSRNSMATGVTYPSIRDAKKIRVLPNLNATPARNRS